MKKLLLILLLLLSGMAQAQIVTIPDPEFKALLLVSTAKGSTGNTITINANGDNEIQVSEALAVWELTLSDSSEDIQSVTGLGAFVNLRKLHFDLFQYLTSLNITTLQNLEKLDLFGCYNLSSLHCAGLEELKSINLQDLDVLESLDCTGLISLEGLTLDHAGITSLQIANLPNLRRIFLENINTHSLDCSGLVSLEELTFEIAHDLETLITGTLPNLVKLHIDDMYYIASIDLSGCPVLDDLELDIDNVGEESVFINLKNGKATYSNFSLTADSNSGISFICIDEGEEAYFTDAIDDNPNILLSSYCSFTPGGDYNTIGGALSFDAANNGCGTGSTLNQFVKINLNDGTHNFTTFSNYDGAYDFHLPAGTFTITPDMENDWFTITPPTATITLAAADNGTTTQNFCIAPNGLHPDVEVLVSPIENVQPGFDARYKVVYRNKGNQQLSGAVTLNYNDSVLDYVSATPVETSSGAGTLTWNYTGLMPFEKRIMIVTLNLNGPMETPAISLGDLLTFSAAVTPLTGDETPADNAFATDIIVEGSFDPNDIACLEGDIVSPDKIGEYLHYNINFENTGTAPATFIVVKDLIDQTKFDVSSFHLLDASHAVEARLDGNKAEFIFDNINLAPAGKGNVSFKIKTLNTLQVNAEVTQQADIFFDYNWPITTNEATTTFEVLSRGDFEKDDSVKIYPNPTKNILNITSDSTVKSIELYDVQGRLLETGIINDISATIDLTARAVGMYFVKVVTEKGAMIAKVVKE